MDLVVMKETMAALRDTIRLIALGGRTDDVEALWRDVQAADYALEEMNKPDTELVNCALALCQPYIRKVGRFEGMIDILKARHPYLKDKYGPVGMPVEKLTSAGHDLWMLCNLLENNYEDHKQESLSGSPSESSGGGHVQQGEIGLQRDGTPEPAPTGSPERPPGFRPDDRAY